ncbi:hypothetical protein BDV95DRAFT_627996 [Massariosphaeria phaeospora]|uniref:HD domain-containing protein n=1 Tax=Massariosphaeria phaeospora TaxID=100035 RepID=A0A7C8I6Y2_9PLEO|nr:hypothetical protein BDV95DRAFT_627996 [Massariosphaeria phaeospora]
MTRLIAGVTVPDTPLINASIALAQESLPINGFHHVMRAWLNGQAIINHLPSVNRSAVDMEAFGVATILHDLGWAFNTSFVSADKWFEVDGAQAARDFIRNSGASESEWDAHRLQLVWDAVALHTNPAIAAFKQPEVVYTSAGTFTEVVGPEQARTIFGDVITVTQTEWEAILEAYPRTKFRSYFLGTLATLCQIKPLTTYDNFLAGFGDKFVPGYNKTGKRTVDLIDAVLTDE